MEFDFEQLREDLLNYYGSAIGINFQMSICNISQIQNASYEQLINIALENGFNLGKYVINKEKKLL